MSGKRTFLDPRDRRHDEVTSDAPPVRPLEWAILKDALRRPLTAAERECVIDLVELHAMFIAEARASRVTSQDIKRTLGALARMKPDEAREAYARADRWTQGQIAGALRGAGIRNGEALVSPGGEQIVLAAKSAIAAIARRAGRRIDDVEFSRAILALWEEFGGPRWAPSARDDYGTPIVRFAAALFRAAGVRPCDLPAVAERLRQLYNGGVGE